METIRWLGEHWFDLFQTLGVVGGLFFTAHSVRKDTKARQISNLISLNDRHDYIWSKFYEQPELGRILTSGVDLRKQPISEEEMLFTKMLLIHLDTVRRSIKAGMLIEIRELKKDVKDFMALPIPNTVWNKIKPFQDAEFIKFVENALK